MQYESTTGKLLHKSEERDESTPTGRKHAMDFKICDPTSYVPDDDTAGQSSQCYTIPADIAACIPQDVAEWGEGTSETNQRVVPLNMIKVPDDRNMFRIDIADHHHPEQSDALQQKEATGADDVNSSDNKSTTASSDTDINYMNYASRKPTESLLGEVEQDGSSGSSTELDETEEIFTCDVCCGEFRSHYCLMRHMNSHYELLSYKCDMCDKAFSHAAKLTRHKRNHIGERPFQCHFCDKSFAHSMGLRQHKQVMHSEELLNHDETVVPDQYSGKLLRRRGNNITYDEDDELSDACSSNDSHSKRAKQQTDSFSCPLCDATFKTLNALQGHQHVHKSDGQFKCDVCDKAFRKKCSLTRHKLTHSTLKPFQCDQCEKSFNEKSKLKMHKRIHSGERPYKCDECSRTFAWSASLSQHKLIHTGERRFRCEPCKKAFKSSTGLIQHMRIHTGERPYQCELCGKTFAQNSARNKHRLVHTKEKPYVCEECGKAYRESSKLSHHRRIVHKGEMPYQCDQCGKSFTRKSGLDKHKLRLHTGEKTLHCDVCNQAFADELKLIQHKNIHLFPRHPCDLCGKLFTRKSGVAKHKRRVHAGETVPCKNDAYSDDSDADCEEQVLPIPYKRLPVSITPFVMPVPLNATQ